MNCVREEHNDYFSGCVFCKIEDTTNSERERIIKLLKRNSSDLGWIQLNIDELVKVIERGRK